MDVSIVSMATDCLSMAYKLLKCEDTKDILSDSLKQ